jgi:pimeloyl-ACP methyl ester carboxylesterase
MTPVLFLPSLLSDGAIWQHQFSSLQDIAECVAAGVVGYDQIEEVAHDVLAKAPQKFALVGLSFGGFVAMEIMRQSPERVLKLCLLDTSARPETEKGKEYRQEQLSRAAGGQYGDVISAMLPMLILRERVEDLNLVNTITAMAHRIGPDGFCNRVKALVDRVDSRPLLSTIRCPVQVIGGLQDALTPPDIVEEIADGIPNARVTLIQDCGHLPPLEQPEEVSRLLREWLLN